MIEYFTLTNAYLLGDVLASMHRLRYSEFVERLGYKVPHKELMEYDQYDTLAAVNFIWRDDNKIVKGSLRISPTSSPYMIKDIWPWVVENGELPESDSVWEATRFCIDHNLPRAQRKKIHTQLLCALHEYALKNAIKGYIGVAPPNLWKYTFIRYGWPIEFLGDAHDIGNNECIRAGFMCISESILSDIRTLNNIEGDTVLLHPDVNKEEMELA